MMKIMLFLIIINLNLIYADDSNYLKNLIISQSSDRNIKFLFENSFEIKKLNDRFFYIYGINPKDLNDESLPIIKDLNINNFKFKKDEKNWWCIFDGTNKKIIIKNDSNYYFWSSAGEFNSKHNLFIFNIGSYVDRHFKIFDLLNPSKKPNEFIAAAGSINNKRQDILISEDYKIVAYNYPINKKWPDEDSEMGIKVRLIDSYKDIIIKPKKENISLEIIKFNKNKLIYREIKNPGMLNKTIITDNLEFILPL